MESMNVFRATQHPGWPARLGPLRVAAGQVTLRPVRLRDAAVWSRIRLADQAHLEPWEPVSGVDWRVRHAVSSWPAICSGDQASRRRSVTKLASSGSRYSFPTRLRRDEARSSAAMAK